MTTRLALINFKLVFLPYNRMILDCFERVVFVLQVWTDDRNRFSFKAIFNCLTFNYQEES